MAVENGKLYTTIVLQGGGALGAYEYGVLKALYKARPGFKPAAVAGISIGAVTAAVLGGSKDPIEALKRLWQDKLTVAAPLPIIGPMDRSLANFGNPGMYRLNAELFTAPWASTSIYDTAPLRRTLAQLVDPALLNDKGTRVVVGATNAGTGEINFFDSYQPGGLTFEHVVASGSLPPSFPMTQIDGESYWDGGLFSNTPLSPAINALEEAAEGDSSAVLELIVIELFPMNAAIPADMSDVLQRIVQLQYTSRLKLDQKFFDKIDKSVEVMAQINVALPKDSPIRENQMYRDMCAHRKINHFNVVTSSFPSLLSNAGDFSRSSIDARIQAGYDDAIAQGIGRIDSEGLRSGITSEAARRATSAVPVA